jgi:hypothetical protein
MWDGEDSIPELGS